MQQPEREDLEPPEIRAKLEEIRAARKKMRKSGVIRLILQSEWQDHYKNRLQSVAAEHFDN